MSMEPSTAVLADYYVNPVTQQGIGKTWKEILFLRSQNYDDTPLFKYKLIHCLNCKKLPKCKLRKIKPMEEPENRFYTCSQCEPKPLELKKPDPVDSEKKEAEINKRVNDYKWALVEILGQKVGADLHGHSKRKKGVNHANTSVS